jgi:hypothetical protein
MVTVIKMTKLLTISAVIATIATIAVMGIIGGIGQQQIALASVLEEDLEEETDELRGCLAGSLITVPIGRFGATITQCLDDFEFVPS